MKKHGTYFVPTLATYRHTLETFFDTRLSLAGFAAFEAARATGDRPTLIVVKSHIGFGAPGKQDTAAAHGEPLGPDEVRAAKRAYGWPEEAKFLVPDAAREHLAKGFGARGRQLRDDWVARLVEFRRLHPALADELDQLQRRELPAGWDAELPIYPPDAKGVSGRDASGKVVNALNGNSGIRKVPSWNAHLSFKTAQKLNAPSWDFPAKVAKDTRFDRMVNMKGDEE